LFDPSPSDVQIHVEWGSVGASLAGARGDIVVIVDVLSFSTSVTLVVSQGATVFSFSYDELDALGGHEAAAAEFNAEIIARDRQIGTSRFTLSPSSLMTARAGDRIIFTSLNGAYCTAAAKKSPVVLIGALTNRSAVANAVALLLKSNVSRGCTLIAAGERWASIAAEHGDAV
jgi:2-phosphosulfolactate phosphatase